MRGGRYQRRVCLSAEGEILSNDCLGFFVILILYKA